MLIILRKNLTLKLLNNYYCIHFLSGGNQYLTYCNSPKTICDPRKLVFLHLLMVMIVTTQFVFRSWQKILTFLRNTVEAAEDNIIGLFHWLRVHLFTYKQKRHLLFLENPGLCFQVDVCSSSNSNQHLLNWEISGRSHKLSET